MSGPQSLRQNVEVSEEAVVDMSGMSYEDEKVETPAIITKRTTRRKHVVDAACISLNIASTVVLVFLNKWIFQDNQLKNMQISFAMWHFTCTTLVLMIASKGPFNLFVPIRLPLLPMIPLCGLFAGFLVLGNLSLAYNSVGFYQLAKIMTTPCVAFFQYLFFRKTTSALTTVALAAVCIGVALTNTGDIGTTSIGVMVATAAFTVTALYQVWIGMKMEDFKVSSPQLLMNQAPIAVVMLACLVPFFDRVPDVSKIPTDTMVALLLSGFAAASLNLSQFLIIGRMSALTYNVSSNCKTLIILAYGWISTGRAVTLKDVLGIILALGGATLYSQPSSR